MSLCKGEGCTNEATVPDPRFWLNVPKEFTLCPKHLDILTQWIRMMPSEWLVEKASK